MEGPLGSLEGEILPSAGGAARAEVSRRRHVRVLSVGREASLGARGECNIRDTSCSM